MDDKDLEYIICVYEEKNFTKAAQKLFISQPALSYRMSQLEKEFGVSILYIKGKKMQFTPEGEYIVKFAKSMLINLQLAKDQVLNMKKDPNGKLSIGIAGNFARYKLSPIIQAFKKLNPKIKVFITVGCSSKILKLLKNGDISIGIVRGEYEWLEKKHLINYEKMIIISSNPICLEELPNLPQIDYCVKSRERLETKYDLTLENEIKRWWNDKFDVPPNISMTVNDVDMCKQMVKLNLGYAIIPGICLRSTDEFYSMDLAYKNGQLIKRNTWMFYHDKLPQTAVTNIFINFIKQYEEE